MAILDTPTVEIAGHTITDEWDPAHPIVCDGLRFIWGRRNIYDENNATTLRLRLIDTTGTLASTANLTGTELTVTRGDGRIIFRGRITDPSIERKLITDPVSRRRRQVWLLDLQASCKMAELAQAVLAGPGDEPVGVEQFGPYYWETQKPEARISAVMAAGADEIVAGIDWTNPFTTGSYWPLVRYRKWADSWSALDHIVALYNIHPVAHVNYDPHANRTRIGKTAPTSQLTLEWDGSTITLDLAGGILVDAGHVGVPQGYKTTRTRDSSKDVVHIVQPNLGPSTGYEIVDTVTERTTSRFNPSTHGRRILRIQNDVYYIPGATQDHSWHVHLANATRNIVNLINDKMSLPQLRFDWRKFDYPLALTQLLIDTYDKPTPLYFYQSAFNPLIDAGVTHQVIGGTLTWEKNGWVLDADLAPAAGTGNGLNINQLVLHNDPTIADFDVGITLADLGNVTQGVPA